MGGREAVLGADDRAGDDEPDGKSDRCADESSTEGVPSAVAEVPAVSDGTGEKESQRAECERSDGNLVRPEEERRDGDRRRDGADEERPDLSAVPVRRGRTVGTG